MKRLKGTFLIAKDKNYHEILNIKKISKLKRYCEFKISLLSRRGNMYKI